MKDRMLRTKPGFHTHQQDFQADWNKNIPEHWEARRLKFVAKIIAGQSPPSEIVSEFTGKYPFLQGNAEFGATSPSPRLSCEKPNKSAEPGDILLSVRAPVGAMNIADQIYGIGRGLCAIMANADISQKYLYHALTTTKETLKEASTGSTYDAVSIGDVGSIFTPVPPPEEQAAIVRYLDAAEQQIQAYISAKQKLIALLEEQRQAIIHQAVTRGLDPNVQLKPSAVEWLDDVPEHWEVSRVKNEFLSLNHRRVPLSSVERGAMTKRKYDYYGASGVIDKVDSYLFNDQLLLIAEDGANLLLRNLPLAIIARGKFWVNNHAHILKPKRGNLEFLAAIMEGLNYSPWISGAAQPKLTQERLMNISIAVPSKEEQDKVINASVEATSTMIQGIAYARRQVELMQEYRTRLIADVVTGKLDVRKAAEELPQLEAAKVTG